MLNHLFLRMLRIMAVSVLWLLRKADRSLSSLLQSMSDEPDGQGSRQQRTMSSEGRVIEMSQGFSVSDMLLIGLVGAIGGLGLGMPLVMAWVKINGGW
jgi:hypothetical protein